MNFKDYFQIIFSNNDIRGRFHFSGNELVSDGINLYERNCQLEIWREVKPKIVNRSAVLKGIMDTAANWLTKLSSSARKVVNCILAEPPQGDWREAILRQNTRTPFSEY